MPEGEDAGLEGAEHFFSAVVSFADPVQAIEEFADLGEDVEDRLASDFGGVRRDDRAHFEIGEDLDDRRRRQAALEEFVERGGEAAGLSVAADTEMVTTAALDVQVLGGVRQQ